MSSFAMVNIGPYYEYVLIDDNAFPASQCSLSPSSARSLSTAKAEDCEIKALCEVFPKLMQWRLFLFYAPFYSFDHAAMNQDVRLSAMDIRPVGRTLKRVLSQKTSKYAAHQARQMAQAVLESMKSRNNNKNNNQVDFIGLYHAYLADKQRYQRRTKLVGVRSMALMPTLKTLKTLAQVSDRLGIPLRQLELALSAYAEHLSSFPWSTEITSNAALQRPDVLKMAEHKQWKELAQIVCDDIEDVQSFSVVRSSGGHVGHDLDQMRMFGQAIDKCRQYYFASLTIEESQCPCGWAHTVCAAVRHGQRIVNSSRTGEIATPWFLSTLWSDARTNWSFGVRKIHDAKPFNGFGKRLVRYKLSGHGKALVDVSGDLMEPRSRRNAVVEGGYRRQTPLLAPRGSVAGIDAGRLLPTVSE